VVFSIANLASQNARANKLGDGHQRRCFHRAGICRSPVSGPVPAHDPRWHADHWRQPRCGNLFLNTRPWQHSAGPCPAGPASCSPDPDRRRTRIRHRGLGLDRFNNHTPQGATPRHVSTSACTLNQRMSQIVIPSEHGFTWPARSPPMRPEQGCRGSDPQHPEKPSRQLLWPKAGTGKDADISRETFLPENINARFSKQ